jgi:hypothetical protein
LVYVLIFSGCLLAGCAAENPTTTEKNVPRGQDDSKPVLESSEMTPDSAKLTVAFKLGDDKIHVVAHQKAPATLTMVNVHHDESTSVEAGLANLNQQGGRLIEFVHSGARLVVFHLDGQKYGFDPNRVFSDAGIKATLEKHSVWSPAAQAAIKDFTAEYLKYFALDEEPVIIALHNTTDGIFSIKSYLPEGIYGSAAAETWVSPHHSPFDFFYTTDKRFYDYLKARDFNVTLQDNKNAPDDGSLSVHFARKGIPYLNIEAEMSHLSVQIEMVNAARGMVDKIIPRPTKS